MKALIVYQSKKGTTKEYAEKIAHYIKKIDDSTLVLVKGITETSAQDIRSCDLLLLGCWTKGRFLIGQKPDQEWINFTQNLPRGENKETVLFTTYTIFTGSMFRNMKKYLLPRGYKVISSMKSKGGMMNYYSFTALKYALNYNNSVLERVLIPLEAVS
jgi:flavodoxin